MSYSICGAAIGEASACDIEAWFWIYMMKAILGAKIWSPPTAGPMLQSSETTLIALTA